MKYIMVLLMSVGICTFSMAQDYNMDNDMSSSSDAKAPMNKSEMSSSSVTTTTATAPELNKEVTTVNKSEKGESVGGVLWRSPFRIVGYTVAGVGKGVGNIGKGVGRIAIAPFRAIGKAFTGHRHKVETETTTTNVNLQPSNVVETTSTVNESRTKENM